MFLIVVGDLSRNLKEIEAVKERRDRRENPLILS